MSLVLANPECPFLIEPTQFTVLAMGKPVDRLGDKAVICAPGAVPTPLTMEYCEPTVLVGGLPIGSKGPAQQTTVFVGS